MTFTVGETVARAPHEIKWVVHNDNDLLETVCHLKGGRVYPPRNAEDNWHRVGFDGTGKIFLTKLELDAMVASIPDDPPPHPDYQELVPPPVEPDGWDPVDIQTILDGGCKTPEPTLCARNDGVNLIYPGLIHSLNGEPESGKSWIAQHCVAMAIKNMQRAAYIDFEDTAPSVLSRFLAMGVQPTQLVGGLTYLQPQGPLPADMPDRLLHTLNNPDDPVAICVIDGVTEAMSTLGLDPLKNDETAQFFRKLVRPIANLGPAVILVDHVVKDRESRGRWAIGSQHKMAALTGASYIIEAREPMGRERTGWSQISIGKDRHGGVRQHQVGKSVIAEFHLSSSGTTVVADLRPPSGHDPVSGRSLGPTSAMEEISKLLEAGSTCTKTELRASLPFKAQTVDIALVKLINGGYIHVHPGKGRERLHASIKPYRQEEG